MKAAAAKKWLVLSKLQCQMVFLCSSLRVGDFFRTRFSSHQFFTSHETGTEAEEEVQRGPLRLEPAGHNLYQLVTPGHTWFTLYAYIMHNTRSHARSPFPRFPAAASILVSTSPSSSSELADLSARFLPPPSVREVVRVKIAMTCSSEMLKKACPRLQESQDRRGIHAT